MNGACRGLPAAMFFEAAWDSGPRPGLSAALAVCRGCGVRDACLEAGLAETEGVWGGTVPPERAALRKARR